MMNDLVAIGFSMSILFVIIFWEQSFDQPLFDKSLTVIPNIQEGASAFKQDAWDVYSNVGLSAISGLPIAVPYIFIG